MKKLVLTALILGLVVLMPICCLAYVGYSVIAYKRPLKPVLQILCSQFPIPSETELVKEWNRKISIAQYRAAPFVSRNSVEWRKFILLKMEDNEINRQKIKSWTFYVELADFYKDHINTAGFSFSEGGLAGDLGQVGAEAGPNAARRIIHPEAYGKAFFRKWSQGRSRFMMTCCYYPPEDCPGRMLNVFGNTTYRIPREFKDTLLVSVSIEMNGSGFTDAPEEIRNGRYWPLIENE